MTQRRSYGGEETLPIAPKYSGTFKRHVLPDEKEVEAAAVSEEEDVSGKTPNDIILQQLCKLSRNIDLVMDKMDVLDAQQRELRTALSRLIMSHNRASGVFSSSMLLQQGGGTPGTTSHAVALAAATAAAVRDDVRLGLMSGSVDPKSASAASLSAHPLPSFYEKRHRSTSQQSQGEEEEKEALFKSIDIAVTPSATQRQPASNFEAEGRGGRAVEAPTSAHQLPSIVHRNSQFMADQQPLVFRRRAPPPLMGVARPTMAVAADAAAHFGGDGSNLQRDLNNTAMTSEPSTVRRLQE
jgi:hypothetical protein